jgi:TldD protein
MSGPRSSADTAFRVADRLKNLPGPWDIFAERTRSFEVHLGNAGVELTRGPILLEGYGLRLLRGRDGKTAIGFQASTDASEEGIAAVIQDAEEVSRYSEFPAKDVVLPAGGRHQVGSPDIVDPALWDDAPKALGSYTDALIGAFDDLKDTAISFGSVKAVLSEVTMANSAGLSISYPHTAVAFEVAIKAFGGPEGAAPGEYWVTSDARRLESALLPQQAQEWSRYARDARRAKSPPSGDLNVVLPPSVLGAILPAALGFKLSGRAQLRELSPAVGSQVGAPNLDLTDDGTIAWAPGSSSVDDEGTPQRQRHLVVGGAATELLYDSLYGNALGQPSTGSASRSGRFLIGGAGRFVNSPGPGTTTLTIPAGDGGTDEELIEAAGDGIWVQQLGWASPDGLTTGFGGEIRIGYRIRNGKLAEPVRGGTVGGVALASPGAPSLLASLAGIGSRPELTGGVYVPTLWVRPLTVAGDEHPGATAGA